MALEKLVMGGYIKGSGVWDPASCPAGGVVYIDLILPGVEPHDYVIWEADDIDWLAGFRCVFNVFAYPYTGFVRLVLYNTHPTLAVDLEGTTWRVLVIKS